MTKIPICEICKNEPATSFSFFPRADRQEVPRDDRGLGGITLSGERLSKAISGDAEIMKEIREASETKDAISDRYNLRYECKFVGSCTNETEVHYIGIKGFFKSADATIGWMSHLHGKVWFDPKDFFKMISRFKKSAGVSGSLPHE